MRAPGRAATAMRAAAVAIGAALLMATACTSETPASTQTLVIHQKRPPVLDPGFLFDFHNFTMIHNLFEPLVRVDDDGNAQPALAESWQATDNNTTWTFKLRSDAKFSDGTPITAEDVRYSFLRALTPVSADEQKALGVNSAFPKGLTILFDLVGAKAVNDGEATTIPEDSITAPDATTLVLKLATPSADLPLRLANPTMSVVKKDNVESSVEGRPWWYAPVASGPFQVAEFVPDSSLTLTPNPHYYGDKPEVDSVQFKVVAESQTAIVAFQANEMDVVKLLYSDVKNLMDAGYADRIMSVDDAGVTVLLANPIGPTADMNVLRAVAMAIDKESLAAALDGLVTPAPTFTTPVFHGYTTEGFQPLEFDVEAAKAELAKSPFAPGDIHINVWTAGDLDPRAIQIIEQMLETNLGINVQILNQLPPANAPEAEAANLLLLTQGPNYDTTCAMPQRWPDFLVYAAGANHTSFGAIPGPGLDEIITECITAPDEAAAWRAVMKFETLLTQYPQFIPIWFNKSYYLVQPRVQGIKFGDDWNIKNLPQVKIANSA